MPEAALPWSGTRREEVLPCVSEASDDLLRKSAAADQGMTSENPPNHKLRNMVLVAGAAAEWLRCFLAPVRAALAHAADLSETVLF